MTQTRRLGRYELLDVLGHGAMGVVYKAHDSFLDRIVAVKTYRQDVPITESVKRRFEREVRTASKLNHPNIVVVHDGGLEQSVPYLAMEFVEGPTLAAELARQGRLPLDRALYIIQKVADGLAYAHAQGVVHRDLKPANILLAGGTEPKIADFGVAKLMSSASVTALTAAVGTPSYMAPEQIDGRAVDARSDVFALGILAYELLTGRQPFVGEGWTAVMFQIMNFEPERPTAIDASLPAAVDRVLARSLAKNPSDRTPDAATFARELADALVPGASPRTPAERRELRAQPEDSLDAGAFEAFRDLAPHPRDRSSRRSSVGPASAAFLLLVGAVALAFFYLRGSGREATPLSRPGTPVAMATVPPPTEAPAPPATAIPTALPTAVPTERPPTPAPTARATERPTEPPRAERTVERPKPTVPAVVARPTVAEAARVEPAPPPVVPTPPVGKPSIDVISDPPGADVLVDGSVKGRTPLRISDLEPGRYRFEVRKEGRSSYRQTAELESNADYTMKVSLPMIINSLRVLSQPDGVDVKLNGVAKGRTPLMLSQLPDGHYDVTAELEGFEPQTFGVDLKDGVLQEVRFTFGGRSPEGR